MDTAVAIRTLEATYKQSADSVAVESMIAKLTEKVKLHASRLHNIWGIPSSVHPAYRHTCLSSQSQSKRHLYWITFYIAEYRSPICAVLELYLYPLLYYDLFEVASREISVSSNCEVRRLFKICPRVPLEWSTICYFCYQWDLVPVLTLTWNLAFGVA